MPDEFHLFQAQLLRETFQPSTYPPERVFVGSDLFLYYSLDHTTWYKRPDWFAALGVSDLYEGHDLRLSYVVWQEPAPPYLVHAEQERQRAERLAARLRALGIEPEE